eukprot:2824264-Pyramimonas_sp.AAC.1
MCAAVVGAEGTAVMFAFFNFLWWSLDALAAGIYPNLTWDNARWPDTESPRRGMGGAPLGFTTACCYIMCDWEGLA